MTPVIALLAKAAGVAAVLVLAVADALAAIDRALSTYAVEEVDTCDMPVGYGQTCQQPGDHLGDCSAA